MEITYHGLLKNRSHSVLQSKCALAQLLSGCQGFQSQKFKSVPSSNSLLTLKPGYSNSTILVLTLMSKQVRTLFRKHSAIVRNYYGPYLLVSASHQPHLVG